MRRTIERVRPVALAVGRVTAAAVLLLLLADCKDIFRPPAGSQMTVMGRAGSEQKTQEDPVATELQLFNPDTFGIVGAKARATVAGLGATSFVGLGLQGTDAEGSATSELKLCFTATETGQPDVFLSQQHRIEVNCPPGAGGVNLEADITLTKNDQPLLVILDGSASIQCGDASVINSGLPPFITSIGIRHQTSDFDNIPDAFSVAIDDVIEMDVHLHAEATSPGPSPSIDVTSSISPGFDFGRDRRSLAAVAEGLHLIDADVVHDDEQDARAVTGALWQPSRPGLDSDASAAARLRVGNAHAGQEQKSDGSSEPAPPSSPPSAHLRLPHHAAPLPRAHHADLHMLR